MRKYTHWLRINRYVRNEAEQWEKIQNYLEQYPELVVDGTVDRVKQLKAEKKSFAEIGNIIGKSRQQAAQIYYKSIASGC